MNNYIKDKELYLKTIINELGYDIEEVTLVPSSRKELGEYQYNGVMSLAKKYNENPNDIAKKIVDKLNNNKDFTNLNIAGPGFINISFSSDSLVKYLNEITKDIKINGKV